MMPRFLVFFSFFLVFVSLFVGMAGFTPAVFAATLNLGPATGTFETGGTFTVSVFLDTTGVPVNAIEAVLRFPPDRLQLVSPSAGKSIIQIWTTQPTYDNQAGEIRLQGGMPGGINVEKGLLTTLTFRAKSTGDAVVRFGDESRVLANDGKGTDVLYDAQGGVYNLVLPPPAGPIVASETHPDQNRWYANPTIVLKWANTEGFEGYSYMLSDLPVDIPDDVADGVRQSVAYRDLKSGTHYFHIKGLRENAWGGSTHFAVNIDVDPPAKFPIEISPARLTTSKTILINYRTTDQHSGLDYYEYAVIPLFEIDAAEQSIFLEGRTPTQLTVDRGKYDVVVRAYDKAGNFRESVQRLRVVSFALLLLFFLLENPLSWLILIAGTIALGYAGWHTRRWYHHATLKHERKELPDDIRQQLGELHRYREKYGKTLSLLVITGLSFLTLLGAAGGASAQENVAGISPPIITTVARDIANDEIFYIGGKTDGGQIEVVIYMQNLQTGETITRIVTSDNKGNWFYRHDSFLSSGKYILWAQERLGELVSAPSPQAQLTVQQTALQLGASRISFETFYLIFALVLLAANASLVSYITIHLRHARKKHKAWLKEVHEAEQSVGRGFAVLKRDIEAELALVRKVKMGKELSAEEKIREEQLLKDLAWAERYIGKEIWDVERAEHE